MDIKITPKLLKLCFFTDHEVDWFKRNGFIGLVVDNASSIIRTVGCDKILGVFEPDIFLSNFSPSINILRSITSTFDDMPISAQSLHDSYFWEYDTINRLVSFSTINRSLKEYRREFSYPRIKSIAPCTEERYVKDPSKIGSKELNLVGKIEHDCTGREILLEVNNHDFSIIPDTVKKTVYHDSVGKIFTTIDGKSDTARYRISPQKEIIKRYDDSENVYLIEIMTTDSNGRTIKRETIHENENFTTETYERNVLGNVSRYTRKNICGSTGTIYILDDIVYNYKISNNSYLVNYSDLTSSKIGFARIYDHDPAKGEWHLDPCLNRLSKKGKNVQ